MNMAIKYKFPYQLILTLVFDDLETLPHLLAKARERVTATRLSAQAGEEAGTQEFEAGWYTFYLRDQERCRKRRASSGGLKRSPAGVNKDGAHYVEITDGILYVEHAQVGEFKAALKELCSRFDYKFVPSDELT